MREFVRQVLVLTLIAVCAALALAGVYELTRERIEYQKRLRLLRALESVLPPHDNEPDVDYVDVKHDDLALRFYLAKKGGEKVGCAVKTWSDAGYGGRIEVLVGILPGGDINNIVILDQRETPGLGAKITERWFLDKLVYKDESAKVRRNLGNTDWRVKKDGGDIDQITGATISPRAVVEAVKTALEAFAEARLFEDAAPANAEDSGARKDAGIGDEPVE